MIFCASVIFIQNALTFHISILAKLFKNATSTPEQFLCDLRISISYRLAGMQHYLTSFLFLWMSIFIQEKLCQPPTLFHQDTTAIVALTHKVIGWMKSSKLEMCWDLHLKAHLKSCFTLWLHLHLLSKTDTVILQKTYFGYFCNFTDHI